ncbi:hypothetical protein [Burkholderia gladioli]|nr:hypothetical protein [Burkholderia gladioli]
MSTPTPPEAGGKPARMVTAIVARGRTVKVNGKSVAAGKEVTLPAAEVAQLRSAGYLVDPKASEVPRNDGGTIGPRLLTQSTVQIKRG